MRAIGLAHDRIRWEEKALFNASKRANISLKLIDSRKNFFDLESADGLRKEFGDVVLQRCISHFRGLHLTAILENAGIYVINPFQVSLTCGNKLFVTLALIKAGVPIPQTAIAFSSETATKALEAIGYPAVMKPVTGSWGRLVSLVKDKESAQALIETRKEIKNALLRIYYLQEFVKRPSRDIRIIVIGGEAVAASYRYSPHDDWRTNVARGGVSKPCPITNELEELSIRAAEAVKGDVVAVDCMEAPEGFVVNEVNGTIEFRGLSSTTNIDVASKIIEYAIKMGKR